MIAVLLTAVVFFLFAVGCLVIRVLFDIASANCPQPRNSGGRIRFLEGGS